MDEGGEKYIASPEMVDSIKLEASSISPHDQERVRALTHDTVGFLTNEFKEYIPEHTLERVKNLEDRVVVVDNDMFAAFHEAWYDVELHGKIAGWRVPHGDMVVVQNPNEYWKQLEESSRQNAIQRHGTEEKAKEVSSWAGFTGTLAHEISHELEDAEGVPLPKWFEECGARYYARLIENHLKPEFFVSYYSEAQIRIYKDLIHEYGEDVHRIFFGSNKNQDRAAEVFASIPVERLQQALPQFQFRIS